MVGFSVYEGKLETSIEKGQEEEGSVSMDERESERGKGNINEGKGGGEGNRRRDGEEGYYARRWLAC